MVALLVASPGLVAGAGAAAARAGEAPAGAMSGAPQPVDPDLQLSDAAVLDSPEACWEQDFDYRYVEGVRLHYRLEGPRNAAAQPLIVIHGAYANLCDPAYALLPEIARDRLVLFVDRPGLGRSQRPRGGADPRVQARLIRDLAAALGLENPLVLGHSYGGAVALAYGLDSVEHGSDPAAASGLLLLAPVSHSWTGGVNWWSTVSDTPVVGFLFRRAVVPVIGPSMVRHAVDNGIYPETYFEVTQPDYFLKPSVFRNNSRDLTNLNDIMAEMSRHYGELDLPIEILAGDADGTVDPDIHARALDHDAPETELIILPGAGHPVHYQRAEAVFAALARLDERTPNAPRYSEADSLAAATH